MDTDYVKTCIDNMNLGDRTLITYIIRYGKRFVSMGVMIKCLKEGWGKTSLENKTSIQYENMGIGY